MGDSYNVEVRLLAITGLSATLAAKETGNQPAEEIIEFAGRVCWDTIEKIGSDPGRIQKWIRTGHESVIEHASATYLIRASRVLTHELVRHRLASYSQKSQRYVRENSPRYISPPELGTFARRQPEGEDPTIIFETAMRDAWAAYHKLLNSGIKSEIARYVLPGACETEIVMTMNFREIRHFVTLRTSPRALPEMRAVAGKILEVMKQAAPRVFADL